MVMIYAMCFAVSSCAAREVSAVADEVQVQAQEVLVLFLVLVLVRVVVASLLESHRTLLSPNQRRGSPLWAKEGAEAKHWPPPPDAMAIVACCLV